MQLSISSKVMRCKQENALGSTHPLSTGYETAIAMPCMASV